MIATTGLLESLRTTAEAGTNLRGGALGAAWTYLLPRQRIGRLVCVGEPSATALARLLLIAEQVDLVVDRRAVPRWEPAAVAEGSGRLRVLGDERELSGGYDLAWAAEGTRRDRIAAAWAASRMRYRERRSLHLAGRGSPRSLGSGGEQELVVRLGPWLGEVRWAAPVADRAATRYVRERRLDEAGLRDALTGRGIPRAGSLARALNLAAAPIRFARVGTLSGLPGPDPNELPAYLRALGPDWLGGRGWVLSTSRAYRTKKVLFYLLELAGSRPDLIVKLAASAADGWLLEQAHRGLTAAREHGLTDGSRAPEAMLFARPDGVTVLIERMIHGDAFEARSHATADCPVARDAVECLAELGERTRRSAPPGAVAAALRPMIARLIDLYRPSARVCSVLADAVTRIEASPHDVPIVGMHGDAGRQNFVVAHDGRVALLDWERWDPAGLALWDIVHFARGYAIWATRRSRPISRLAAFRIQFVDGGRLTPFVARAIDEGSRRLGVERSLVAPLVLASIAAQAVREAERLEERARGSGHFIRVLELLCASLDGPVTRRLLGLDAPGGR